MKRRLNVGDECWVLDAPMVRRQKVVSVSTTDLPSHPDYLLGYYVDRLVGSEPTFYVDGYVFACPDERALLIEEIKSMKQSLDYQIEELTEES